MCQARFLSALEILTQFLFAVIIIPVLQMSILRQGHLSKLPKLTQLVSDEAGIWSPVVWFPNLNV